MAINKLHASHIRRVNVGFIVSGFNFSPVQFTKIIGIQPNSSAQKGDNKYNINGCIIGHEKEGWWRIDSKYHIHVSGIKKKDINEHLKTIIEIILPKKKIISNYSKIEERNFDILWESTYLYAGTGPIIEQEWIKGISSLKASIGFDIYQIDE